MASAFLGLTSAAQTLGGASALNDGSFYAVARHLSAQGGGYGLSHAGRISASSLAGRLSLAASDRLIEIRRA